MRTLGTSLAGAACVAIAVWLWNGTPERLREPALAGFGPWLRTVRSSVAARAHSWTPLAVPLGIGAPVLVFGPLALVPSGVAIGSAVLLLRRRRVARGLQAQHKQDRDDVSALRALAAELRSGLPPAAALRAAAGGGIGASIGLRHRMIAAASADKLGGDAAQSLGRGSEPGSMAAGVAAAWAVCQITGASLAAPVSRIADAAASQLLLTREADAALASARSSAQLLAVLPVAGVGLGVLSGTGSLRVLLASAPGQLCLLVGVGLDLAGLAWLDRMAGAG